MKTKRLILIATSVLLLALLSGCSKKENKYVRIAVPEYVDGMSLYLTGTASGLLGVSNYVYIDGTENYVKNVLEKMTKSYAGVDIAYFEAADLKEVFSSELKDSLKIVYIDSYNEDGTIKSVFVARDSWMTKCPKYFPKLIKGFAQTADYRAKNCTLSGDYSALLESLKNAGKKEGSFIYKLVDFTDYNFSDYTNVYEYCAIYNIQNDVDEAVFNKVSAVFKDNEFAYSSYASDGITLSEVPALIALYKEIDTETAFESIFSLSAMNDGIVSVKNSKPSEKKSSPLQAILWGSGLLLIVILAVILLIRKKRKTGRKIFDIKRALDADIESYDGQ